MNDHDRDPSTPDDPGDPSAAPLMRVARLHRAGEITLADEPRPVPGAGQELVAVRAVGICGSDLHWFTEGSIGDAVLGAPLVLGHEMSGVIASGPRAGQRVAVDPAIPCTTCPPCREGNPNLCINVVFAGHGSTDGGMRQFLAWPADRLHAVPDSVDDVDAAMLEPLGVAIHAVDLAHLRLAGTVAVVGCGPIGQLAVRLALLAGAAHVLGVDPLAHRRELAAEAGARSAEPASATEVVSSVADGIGFDAVIEVAGTDEAVDLSIALCRPGGRVVLTGIPDDNRTTFTAAPARRKGLTIALSRRMKDVYPRAIELAAGKRINLSDVVSHEYGLADATEAMQVAAQRRGHKVIIHP
jgi:L-iditol 2-dehydrogenase